MVHGEFNCRSTTCRSIQVQHDEDRRACAAGICADCMIHAYMDRVSKSAKRMTLTLLLATVLYFCSTLTRMAQSAVQLPVAAYNMTGCKGRPAGICHILAKPRPESNNRGPKLFTTLVSDVSSCWRRQEHWGFGTGCLSLRCSMSVRFTRPGEQKRLCWAHMVCRATEATRQGTVLGTYATGI